ncbi:addiction module toxin RelE [Candidatus Woesearchaeota archaeon]|nr:addiction module toxin RelE [Candidatus Woesearchaeota archaeon]
MRSYEFSDQLKKILAKLFKKDKKRYEILLKKVEEILVCEDIEHYKNLRKPLQHLKRVHIDTHFVLTFEYNKVDDSITFYDFDHHDVIYKQ